MSDPTEQSGVGPAARQVTVACRDALGRDSHLTVTAGRIHGVVVLRAPAGETASLTGPQADELATAVTAIVRPAPAVRLDVEHGAAVEVDGTTVPDPEPTVPGAPLPAVTLRMPGFLAHSLAHALAEFTHLGETWARPRPPAVRLPIVAGDLLELADTLAAMTPARPQTIHLRRAVSSAHYAVFHELVAQAARRTVGADPARQADRYTVSRWYAHGELRTVSRWVVNSAAGRTLSDRIAAMLDRPAADLVAVASSFIVLQNARHEADDDHHANITGRDTRGHIARARDTLTRLPRLHGDRVYDNYLMLLLGGPKIPTR